MTRNDSPVATMGWGLPKPEPRPRPVDEFHKHEVVDRACIIHDMIARHLIDHPAVVADDDLKELVEKASDAMWAVYQLAGEKYL